MDSDGRSVVVAVLDAPGEIRIRELPMPVPGPEDALLRPRLVGICGTDCKIYDGSIPVPYPLILGHEIVGEVTEMGAAAADRLGLERGDLVVAETSVPCWSCRQCRSGDYRFCSRRRAYGINTPITEPPGLWGGLAECMYLAPGSILHRVPAGMTPKRALVATLLANGIEWVQALGGLRAGDAVVIQGCGPQGLAAAVAARAAGASRVIMTGLGRDAARLQLAARLGVDTTLIADQEDVAAWVTNHTEGGADVVLDVTGAPASPAVSVRMVRTRGTLVLAGLSGGRMSELRLDDVVNREIRIQGAFVKGEAAFRSALALAGQLGPDHPVDEIVSHVFPLGSLADAITAACTDRTPAFIKAAIAP
ncbi:MAG: zinc-dependent alcohol dehydrogenase [Candidatus Limnocylindria bacterium]